MNKKGEMFNNLADELLSFGFVAGHEGVSAYLMAFVSNTGEVFVSTRGDTEDIVAIVVGLLEKAVPEQVRREQLAREILRRVKNPPQKVDISDASRW